VDTKKSVSLSSFHGKIQHRLWVLFHEGRSRETIKDLWTFHLVGKRKDERTSIETGQIQGKGDSRSNRFQYRQGRRGTEGSSLLEAKCKEHVEGLLFGRMKADLFRVLTVEGGKIRAGNE